MVNNKLKMDNKKSKIFILHGWTYSIDKWLAFAGKLKSNNLDPAVLKIPGLTDKIDRPWIMEDYVNWLLGKVKNKKRKIILIGHSNGGRIAMAFSIKYPEKVEKLILIDSAGIYHDELYLKLKRGFFGIVAKTGRKFLKLKFAKDFLYFLVGERDYKEASENMKRTMINLLEWEKTFRPEEVAVPTVIIWGKHDGMTPVSDGKLLNEKIISSKLYIVNNARHSPQFSHPKEVSEIILENIIR